jgi:putative membrane protein
MTGEWYLVLKAAHLIAVFTWVSGTLLLAWSLHSGQTGLTLEPAARRHLQSVARWDRTVTSPALLSAWALGFTLAKLGGWFPAPWLLTKVVLALALAGIHGYLLGRLRKSGAVKAVGSPASLPLVIVVLAACAIGLAITKPI